MKFEVGEICEVWCISLVPQQWRECEVISVGPGVGFGTTCGDYVVEIPSYPPRPFHMWAPFEKNMRKKQPPESCDDEFFEDFKKIIQPELLVSRLHRTENLHLPQQQQAMRLIF